MRHFHSEVLTRSWLAPWLFHPQIPLKTKNFTPQEKVTILRRHLIDKVQVSDLCEEYHCHPSLFYRWLKQFFDWRARYGKVNEHNHWVPRDFWLEEREKQAIVEFHDRYPLEGYRRLTFMMLDQEIVAVSPSSVWRVLKAAGRLAPWNGKPSRKGTGFQQPLAPHQHWHVDISYLNLAGTFYYLCSMLDGYSRYLVHWEIRGQREKEITTIADHVEISLNALIHRQNLRMAELLEQQQAGDANPLLAANLKTTEDRLDELNSRLERRRAELEQERHCTIADIRHHGRAWVLPHPERTSPGIAPMVRDDEIERIAVEAVIAYEEARGWRVESVEKDNRGFDLISRRLHPEDPATAIEVRFIEVKGRAGVGEIALSTNEFKTAERLKRDFWLYAVFNCGSNPEIHIVQDPIRLGWEPIVSVEHYHVGADAILKANV